MSPSWLTAYILYLISFACHFWHARIYEVGLLQVYVIGHPLKLGRWKVQDGLKLDYAGESIWQANSVMQKDDFPIRYPLKS